MIHEMLGTPLRRGALSVLGAVGTAAILLGAHGCPETAVLEGRAVLPALTFASGPTSGEFITPANGVLPPFVNQQPVQGFSAVHDNKDGTYWVMCDNGYGSLENSADFNLRLYRIRPHWKTQAGGSGNVGVLGRIELSDPWGHVPWPITNEFTSKRLLTGADFDIESMQRTPDGDFWIGDEFGPFILHTDPQGRLVEPPIGLPDLANPGKEVRSPQNPKNEEGTVLRMMNAVRAHARKNGNARTPVCSPWNVMLDDNNDTTAGRVETRVQKFLTDSGSATSNLVAASSDIFNVALAAPPGTPEISRGNRLHAAGYPVVVWTVNDKPRMIELMKLGVDGIISDRADLLQEAVQEFDANNDGVPGDFLDVDGLVDPSKFDAQGHRGSRNLRPENSIPAIEACLDHLMSTIECDTGVTKDRIAILSHDPYVESAKCRRKDGAAYGESDEVLIRALTVAQIQSTFANDKLFRGPSQLNDPALSPVSLSFFGAAGLPTDLAKRDAIYIHPTLEQVFDFVKHYAAYYDGIGGAEAAKRSKNAKRVRFNIETKLNPRTDADPKGIDFVDRTFGPNVMLKAVAEVIEAFGWEERADVQSFDFRTLLRCHEKYPAIRTVFLFGDFPEFAERTFGGSDDGTNMQPQPGETNTRWMAGMTWPYRVTSLSDPFRSPRSGGFEGMALTKNKKKLLPLLELPLAGDDPKTLLIHEYDIAAGSYTGTQWKYRLAPGGTNIGDFILFNGTQGLILERDNLQGPAAVWKILYEVTLGAPGDYVDKELLVDLLDITDPDGVAQPAAPGDYGILPGVFRFPFQTIESVVVLDPLHVVILNDNNFPFSVGRHVGPPAKPDDNEIIRIGLPRPLGDLLE